jgi:YHS domain-containing protein
VTSDYLGQMWYHQTIQHRPRCSYATCANKRTNDGGSYFCSVYCFRKFLKLVGSEENGTVYCSYSTCLNTVLELSRIFCSDTCQQSYTDKEEASLVMLSDKHETHQFIWSLFSKTNENKDMVAIYQVFRPLSAIKLHEQYKKVVIMHTQFSFPSLTSSM